MQNLNLCTRSLFHWGQLEILNKTDLPIERCTTKDGVLHVLPKFSSLILSTVFFFWMITLLFIVFLLQLILSSIKFRTSVELSSELSFPFFSACTVVHWVAWKLPDTWATRLLASLLAWELNPSRGHSTGLPLPCLRGMVMVLVKGPNSVWRRGLFLVALEIMSCIFSYVALAQRLLLCGFLVSVCW